MKQLLPSIALAAVSPLATQWDSADAAKTYPLTELALLPEDQLAGKTAQEGSVCSVFPCQDGWIALGHARSQPLLAGCLHPSPYLPPFHLPTSSPFPLLLCCCAGAFGVEGSPGLEPAEPGAFWPFAEPACSERCSRGE